MGRSGPEDDAVIVVNVNRLAGATSMLGVTVLSAEVPVLLTVSVTCAAAVRPTGEGDDDTLRLIFEPGAGSTVIGPADTAAAVSAWPMAGWPLAAIPKLSTPLASVTNVTKNDWLSPGFMNRAGGIESVPARLGVTVGLTVSGAAPSLTTVTVMVTVCPDCTGPAWSSVTGCTARCAARNTTTRLPSVSSTTSRPSASTMAACGCVNWPLSVPELVNPPMTSASYLV